jgi:[CysO sulfur-carrier protein]-S-L-cysteine hydrolase
MSAMSGFVRVTRAALDEMLAEARSRPNQECCGLLAGREGVISLVLPARNALSSATAYEVDPPELFALFRRMRAEGLEHMGIYHSHPQGQNSPSPRDIERAFYPEAAYFILSPRANSPRPIRAFRIAEGQTQELAIHPV